VPQGLATEWSTMKSVRHPAHLGPRPRHRGLRVAAAAAMLAAVGAVTHTASASTVPDGTGGGGGCSGAADESLEPYVIGYINQEAGSIGTYPEASAASQAAVDYINTELCGFDGHPIELDSCQTDGTPAASQRCAEQMVNDDVPFVTGGFDLNMQSWYSILGGAGIPVIGGIPVSGADFNAENSYMFIGGGATSYPGLAAYILEFMDDVDSVGILANDTEGAAAAIPLVEKPLEAAGIDVKVVQVPATQADWLAPFTQLNSVDAIAVLVGPANCISVAQARDSQQSDMTMVSVSSCYSASVLEGAGENGLDGWVVNQYFEDPHGDTPDAQTYQRAMAEYAGDDANLSGFAPTTFSNMMTLYDNLLSQMTYDEATTEALVARVEDPAGGQVFMGPTYVCGAPDAPFAAICNVNLQWFEVSEGVLTNPTGYLDLTDVILVGQS